MADKFQSIFDDNVEAEKQFDTMFGAEEDDKLIEAVLAVSEGELPDFEELHQTDDDAKPKDLADELGPDHDKNKPTADSSDQEIIADDDDEILDLACPKLGVQDAVQKNEPDNTDITDEIEKSETKLTNESLQSLLDEADTDLGDNEGLGEPGDLGDADGLADDTSDTEELTDNEDKNEKEEMKDPVEESTSLVDQLLAEAEDPEQSVDAEYTDPEDKQGEPDVNNNAKAGAEGTDKDPVYEETLPSDSQNDNPEVQAANGDAPSEDAKVKESTSLVDQLLAECDDPECSVDGEYTDPEDGQGKPDINNNAKAGAEGTDKDPVYEADVEDSKDTDADDVSDGDTEDDGDPVGESTSLVDQLLAEEADELPEEVEDEVIADVEDDSEMSDSDVDAIDDIYDEDILDDMDDED